MVQKCIKEEKNNQKYFEKKNKTKNSEKFKKVKYT